MFLFVLLSSKVDVVAKKRYSKGNAVRTFSFSNDKVIFILLTEVIIFYVGFTKYTFGDPAFKNLFKGFLEVVKAQTFKIVLKTRYKFFLVYLRIKNSIIESFRLRRLANWLDNSLSNLEREKKSKSYKKTLFAKATMVTN